MRAPQNKKLTPVLIKQIQSHNKVNNSSESLIAKLNNRLVMRIEVYLLFLACSNGQEYLLMGTYKNTILAALTDILVFLWKYNTAHKCSNNSHGLEIHRRINFL